jgi:regulatory protein
MSISEAETKAMAMCSRKEYSSYDVRCKLIEWECVDDSINTIMAVLTEKNYIDDERFAAAFVNDKIRFNKWGKYKTAMMLKQHNVDKKIIDKTIESFNKTEYQNILTAELKKKQRSLKTSDKFEVKNKLFRFAAGRGFEPDVINKAILSLSIK